MHELSFTNLVAAAGTTLTASSEDTSFPLEHLQRPQAPMLPFKMTATGQQTITINYGIPTIVRLLLLNRVNFLSVTVEGNPTDSWGVPAFSQAFSVRRNPLHGRYVLGVFLSGFVYQFQRLVIPAQDAVRESEQGPASVWLIGGVWAGVIAGTPLHYQWDARYARIEPQELVEPAHRGWGQRLKLGVPRVQIRGRRWAPINPTTPWVGDLAADWAELDRRMWEAETFAFHTNLGDSSQVYVARLLAPIEWQMVEPGLVESEFVVDEVLGP